MTDHASSPTPLQALARGGARRLLTAKTRDAGLRLTLLAGMLTGIVAPLIQPAPAIAADASSATLSGGSGTVTVGGALYAKPGAALTLAVTTSSDTKCVEVAGSNSATAYSATAKTSWSLQFAAASGDGTKSLKVTASPQYNLKSTGDVQCTGNTGQGGGSGTSASYVVDSTSPVLTATLAPAANAAGWNNSNVAINWSAADSGSGIGSGPSPATDSVDANTTATGVNKSSTATDRVGNSGSGTVIVKLDKTAPSITGSRSPAANPYGWNNTDVSVSFTCDDALSGIKSCAGSATLSANGANQSVAGTAQDNADNTATASVGSINIDKTAPTVTGQATAAPNGDGWYKGDVSIRWTCADSGGSGIDGTCPTSSTITGEGSSLGATSAAVKDKAGNTTSGAVSGIKIDRTAPSTSAAVPGGWTNAGVSVTLSAEDNLSGIKATYFRLNGGAQQTGASVSIVDEGVHSIAYWSEDRAGNTEAAKVAEVRIDKTAPGITAAKDPSAVWSSVPVTVSFTCADLAPVTATTVSSGIKSCTAPQSVTAEGENQIVSGTAVDNAGNSSSTAASVSIDTTKPTITAAADRAANASGWYSADVTVSFVCKDVLSGVADCTAPKTLGEGANQTASGTATDKAGNTSAAATVSSINVDKSNPTLTGKATAASVNSWYRVDVAVEWACADALSGIDGACPTSSTIAGEGNNLSASATISDRAGNTTSSTVSGIKIDRTAPATSIGFAGNASNGWFTSAVTISLTAAQDLSGIDKTYYRIDEGQAQVYGGPFSYSAGGVHSITFWSVDMAGNVEDSAENSRTFQIDSTPPTIKGSRTPEANRHGWNNAAVTVGFACDDKESGLVDGTAGCSQQTTVDEGANQSVAGKATDRAGNSAEASVSGINVDTTAPAITASATSGGKAYVSGGWTNQDVVVTFTCSDTLSTIDTCTKPVTISSEGAKLSALGEATDKAGNTAQATFAGVNIDRTKPAITVSPDRAPTNGWYSDDVTLTFACSDNDAGSGIPAGACPAPRTLGAGVNQTGSASVSDTAGNTGAVTFGPISIDKVAPSISGAPAGTLGNGGWYTSDVTVNWTCADDGGSALAGTCAPSIISTEGSNLSASATISDNAGNSSTGKVEGIKIDKTAPVTKAQAPTGWSAEGVSVSLKADDGGSGVIATYYRVNGGAQQTGTSVDLADEGISTVTFWSVDAAGNAETTKTAEVRIDRSAPSITGSKSPESSWSNGPVTVSFTCADTGSGIATCTAPQTVTSEGKAQEIVGTANNNAGTSATETVLVNIDLTPPSIGGQVTTKANAHGWYKGDVLVQFTCTDVLSSIDMCAGTQTVTSEGKGQTATGYASDVAGNISSFTVDGIDIDRTRPDLDGALLTGSNNHGWLGGDAIVQWTCGDTLSGIDGACPADTTVKGEGNDLSATESVSDKAGNTTSKTVSGIKIDRTAPTISGTASGKLGADGWYVGPVTVKFACDDKLSGIASCASPVTLSSNGVELGAKGSAADKAGNLSETTISGIKIDQTAPTITSVSYAQGSGASTQSGLTLSTTSVTAGGAAAQSGPVYLLGAVPAPECSATDNLGGSGLMKCEVKVTGGNANGVGTFTYTATATDKAGNSVTQTGTFRVIYRFDGFLQPITANGHKTPDATTSTFKLGSTVPVKFQLKRADGTVLQASGLPVWIGPATSGTSYRWDSSSQQYLYNFKTSATPTSHRIGVTLDDGETYYVTIAAK